MILCTLYLLYRMRPPTTTSSGTTNSSSFGGGTGNSGTGNSGTGNSGTGGPDLLQMLSQMQGGAGAAGRPAAGGAPPPGSGIAGSQMQQAEVLYQSQLEQLQNMGFLNRQANLNGQCVICCW